MKFRRPVEHDRQPNLTYDRFVSDDGMTGSRTASGADQRDLESAERTGRAKSICHVVHEDQIGELHLSRESGERLLASGSVFWIDIYEPTESDFAVLRDVFHFHQLALEDTEQF